MNHPHPQPKSAIANSEVESGLKSNSILSVLPVYVYDCTIDPASVISITSNYVTPATYYETPNPSVDPSDVYFKE